MTNISTVTLPMLQICSQHVAFLSSRDSDGTANQLPCSVPTQLTELGLLHSIPHSEPIQR